MGWWVTASTRSSTPSAESQASSGCTCTTRKPGRSPHRPRRNSQGRSPCAPGAPAPATRISFRGCTTRTEPAPRCLRSPRTFPQTASEPRTSRRPVRNRCSWTQVSGATHCRARSQMPLMPRVAIQEATAKRGVSVLVVPGNVALLDVTGRTDHHAVCVELGRVRPPESQVQQLADAINAADRRSCCSAAPASAARMER